jgi:hypothetical protein
MDGEMQLQAYFDESGEHDRVTGHLLRLHVGGVLAPTEEWCIIDEQWRDALRQTGISVVHMKDLASTPPRGEFKGWTPPRCHALLSSLLDILAARAPKLSLINVSFPAHGPFKKLYPTCVAQAINGVCSTSFLYHHYSEISAVFAETNSSFVHTSAFWEKVRKEVPSIGSCNPGKPELLSQLQDLVCYEFSHMDKVGTASRYPLVRLLQDQKSFHIRRIP